MRRRNDKIGETTSSYLNSQNLRKLIQMTGRKKILKNLWDYTKYLQSKHHRKSLEKAIRLEKALDEKERPLLVTLKEENKKREIFKNLKRIREAVAPFNKVTIVHDLTIKQKKELKEKIEQAREKERNDESGEFMYRVHGPPWSWYIKKIKKNF